MKISELGEFALIKTITEIVGGVGDGVIKGIGDDVAVLRPTPGKSFLATADLLLDGVHFKSALTDPYRLGRKAVAVNLSDIAGCGGIPRALLVSLAIPSDEEVDSVRSLYQGMKEQAAEFGVSLVGGDTSRGKKLMISITLIGEAEEGAIMYRHGARKGDLIFVTGTVGDAALGFAMLKQGKRGGKLVERHLTPLPRVREGQMIARQRLATAMIDISDGLAADFGHIAEASKVGGKIWLPQIPLSEEYRREIGRYSSDPYIFALTGGEDYELLFTSPPGQKAALQTLADEMGFMITPIGEIIEASQGVKIYREDGKEYPVKAKKGYDHFRG